MNECHQIDRTTGKAAFVERLTEVVTKAWHGLGKSVTHALDTKNMLELAILNWKVSLAQNEFQVDGKTFKGESYSVYRDDTKACLGTVGERYEPFQNSELAGLLDSFMGESQAFWATAGSLFGGRKIFMTAILPREVYANGDKKDAEIPYVVFTTSHDGSGQIEIFLSMVRVVCNNTLTIALGKKGKGLKVRHTKNCREKIASWSYELGLINKALDNHEKEVAALSHREVSVAETHEYFESLFPTKKEKEVEGANLLDAMLESKAQQADIVSEMVEVDNKRNQKIGQILLENLVRHDNRISDKISAWDLYNAVSYYTDHQAKSKGRNDSERENNLVDSIHFGRLDAIKTEAWEKALQLAN